MSKFVHDRLICDSILAVVFFCQARDTLAVCPEFTFPLTLTAEIGSSLL